LEEWRDDDFLVDEVEWDRVAIWAVVVLGKY